MRSVLTICAAAFLALVLGGCAQHTQPVAPIEPHTRGQENFTATWDATLEILRRYYFEVDRRDRRAGVINTRPMVSRHWFEFWRGDSYTLASAVESSMQTVLRMAEVTIRPSSPGADTYTVSVKVTAAISNRPDAQITSTSEAYALFATLSGDEKGRAKYLMNSDTNTNKARSRVYRDSDLEQRLTAEIQAEAAKRRALHSQYFPAVTMPGQ